MPPIWTLLFDVSSKERIRHMRATITRREFGQLGLAAAASLAVVRLPSAKADTSGFDFFVLGDWSHTRSGQRRVARAMEITASGAPPRFVISTGDNFYPSGVTSITDPLWAEAFENIYSTPSLRCPWYVILGNHDHKGNTDAQVAYTNSSSQWFMPSPYYHRRETIEGYIFAEFVFLDTNPIVEHRSTFWNRWIDPAPPDKQISWLETVLRESTATWKIVVGHHPVFSGGPHGPSAALAERVKPLLEKFGVQAYFNGHEHNLQHYTHSGVHYLSSGSGSDIRQLKDASKAKFSAATLGFLRGRLTASSLTVDFINDDARILQTARIDQASLKERLRSSH